MREAPLFHFAISCSDDMLAVDADGVCISPNDVSGYDKDKHMPDNGTAYAHRDANGS